MEYKEYVITCLLGGRKFYYTKDKKWTENTARALVFQFEPSLSGLELMEKTNTVEEYIDKGERPWRK